MSDYKVVSRKTLELLTAAMKNYDVEELGGLVCVQTYWYQPFIGSLKIKPDISKGPDKPTKKVKS